MVTTVNPAGDEGRRADKRRLLVAMVDLWWQRSTALAGHGARLTQVASERASGKAVIL